MKSLHVRLALVLSAVVGALTVGLLAAASWSADRHGAEVRQALNREVAAHVVEGVQPFAGDEINMDALKALFMDVMVVNPSLEVYLLDTAGQVLAFDAPEERIVRRRVDLEPVQHFLLGESGSLIEGDDPRDPIGKKPFTAAPVHVDDELRGYLYIVVGGEEFDSAVALLRGSYVARVFLIAALGLAVATALVGAVAFSRLTRPLRQVRASIAAFREDKEHIPVNIEGDDEIAGLASTYDRLATRVVQCVQNLEKVDRDRREFVANVSHDLRTPLASLAGYLELLREHPDLDPETRLEYVQSASRRASQLASLVDQLFELARLESGDVPLSTEAFSPAELAHDVVQSHRLAAGKLGIELVCRMPRSVPNVKADIGLIERALDNLVSNATRHTDQGGQVEIALDGRKGSVLISVRDTGPGITPSDLPLVFDRAFHRDRADSTGGVGTGLGLAITRRIVELHGGRIGVESPEGQGAAFHFTLPAASA